MNQEDKKRLESVNQQSFEDSQTLAAVKKEKLKAELELQKAQESEGIVVQEMREVQRERDKIAEDVQSRKTKEQDELRPKLAALNREIVDLKARRALSASFMCFLTVSVVTGRQFRQIDAY